MEDFAEPDLLSIFREFLPRPTPSEAWPLGNEDRKFWEIGMALLSVRRCVPQENRVRALGVGAGKEATNFILTNLFSEVLATDRYGGPAWASDAPALMLNRPEYFAGQLPFIPERLVVQHMDARELRYKDGLFDFIYSSSSLEHFGSDEDIARSIAEMARVLRPGGILSISTEFRVFGNRRRLGDNTLLFHPASIDELILRPSKCLPVDTPSFTVTAATHAAVVPFQGALADLQHDVNRMERIWSMYPHIIISDGDVAWTSVHLCLQKR